MILKKLIVVALLISGVPHMHAVAQSFVVEPDSIKGKALRTSVNDDFIYRFRLQMKKPSQKRYTLGQTTANIVDEKGRALGTAQIKLNVSGDFTEYTYFDVSLADIKYSGKYAGEIVIRLTADGKVTEESRIPVQLSVEDGIEVEKAGEVATATLVNTTGSIFYKAAPFFITRYKIKNKNGTPEIAGYEMVLRGAKRGDEVTEKILSPSQNASLKEEVKIAITERDIRADTYQGWLKVFIKDQEEPIRFESVTLKVKDGPLYVILTLIFGLIIGRALRIYNSKDVQEFYSFRDRINHLKKRTQNAPELLQRLEDVEDKLALYKFDSTEIEKELNDIEVRMLALENASSDNKDISTLSRQFADKNTSVVELMEEQSGSFDLPERLSKTIQPVSFNDRTKSAVNKITGLGFKTIARGWGFRAVLFTLTWILVLLLGYQLNYLNKPDFGEMGFYDYFNVFLWASGSTAILKSIFSVS